MNLNNIIVLGHRGFREKFPENTLLSFRKSLDAGSEGVECDLQKTLDSYYIVIHDDSIDRTSNGKGKVPLLKLEEIRHFDFGSGEKAPEFSELIKTIPSDSFLNIELKSETITIADCPVIYAMFKDYRKPGSTMISSFQIELLSYFKKKGIITGLLVGELKGAWKSVSAFLRYLSVSPPYVNLPVEMFRRLGRLQALAILKILKLTGKKIAFWTVNTKEDLDLVVNYSDIIITDRVEYVRAYLDITSSRSAPVDI